MLIILYNCPLIQSKNTTLLRINPAQSDTFYCVPRVVLTSQNSQTILDKTVGTLCHNIIEFQFLGLHETPAPPPNVAQKEWLYAVNWITVVNIVKGSGGVPTSFVQDCLSSNRAINKNKFNRKWLFFRADVFRKVFFRRLIGRRILG